MKQKESFTREFTIQTVAQFLSGKKTVEEIIDELGLRKDQFKRWVDKWGDVAKKRGLVSKSALNNLPTIPKRIARAHHNKPMLPTTPSRITDEKDLEILHLKAKIHDLREELDALKRRFGIRPDDNNSPRSATR